MMKKILSYLVYILILLFLFQFIITPSKVVSGSMEPTIMTNDILLYNRLEYLNKAPSINDIVVFEYNGEILCKRIVGVGGDEISFVDGLVYRNGEKVEESFLNSDVETNCMKSFTVPEGCFFVLGDNRENSYDSRYWENPYIKEDDILGKYWLSIPIHLLLRA